ncbi:MAG TPA: hypothetical protein VH083_09320 [Myxococcales bacterium]|nr:hypothetical protein [Myxococcales bacterium]
MMSRATWLLLFSTILACSSNRPGNLGETCATEKDCSGGLSCYLATSPGVCTQTCTESTSCPNGTACAALVSNLGDQLCLNTCTSNASCSTGNVCCRALGNVCVPATKCTGQVVPVNPGDLSCSPRQIINGGLIGPVAQPDGCQKPIANITYPGAQPQVLGAFQVGSKVNFNVPAGTGTISILQQVVDGGAPDTLSFGPTATSPNGVVPFQVTGPDGGVYFDDDFKAGLDLSSLEVAFSSPTAACAAMTLPNTTQALSHELGGYQPGIWTLEVNDYAYECSRGDQTVSGCAGGSATQQYDIQIITKPIMGEKGTIDLGIYLVSDNWTAKAAIADANGAWTRMLDTMAAVYAGAGICLGNVTFYDMPAWAKALYATNISATEFAPCSSLDQMFTLSQPGGAIPLFFVDDVASSATGGGGQIVGIDGAIPGPAGAGGTVHSGALVNVTNLLSNAECINIPAFHDCGADQVAYIAAHEGAHYMGLYHTTESNGALFDPVGDTSQCAPECDLNHDGAMSGPECSDDSSTTESCGGSANTMFWLLSVQARGQFSTDQGQILRANPAVY